MGYSPWGCKELHTAKHLNNNKGGSGTQLKRSQARKFNEEQVRVSRTLTPELPMLTPPFEKYSRSIVGTQNESDTAPLIQVL